MTAQRPERTMQAVPKHGSRTRAASNRRVARVAMLHRGNTLAWRHGVFAQVAALPDVETEVGLLFAAWPALDPSRDRRLIEHMGMTQVRLRRAFLALDGDQSSPVLTRHYVLLSALAERLEQQVRDAARQRAAEATAAGRHADLAAYRPSRGGLV